MKNIPSDSSSSQLRLDEFKAASDKEWARKETLESRAMSIVQVAGTTTALMFGFVTFIQTSNKFSFTSHIENVIIASILIIIASIVISILVLLPRNYSFRIAIDDYFRKNEKGESIFDVTTLMNPIDKVEDVIGSYARMIMNNKHINDSKAILIITAAILLVAGLALSAIVVIELFRIQPSAESKTKGEFTCKELAAGSTKVIANNKMPGSEQSLDSGVLLCISNSK